MDGPLLEDLNPAPKQYICLAYLMSCRQTGNIFFGV